MCRATGSSVLHSKVLRLEAAGLPAKSDVHDLFGGKLEQELSPNGIRWQAPDCPICRSEPRACICSRQCEKVQSFLGGCKTALIIDDERVDKGDL
ncbi:hypothetical protein SAMN02982931_01480 [Bauldia litoralis]|uniref:Uncharacterized protein n=1 Tax=Bauldia litoralis TaxID=665467 RepID=A0A1G6BI57_9HYPH|nr:hypothetical protein SAMN02982931_01480 [Bauldia litoralis]